MYCLLGFALVGSMILCMFMTNKGKYNNNFEKLLDCDQKKKYKSIKKERLRIYLEGHFIGILIALLVCYNIKLESCKKICLFLVTSIGINYLYYNLIPKRDYMLKHLNSMDQNKAWLEQYLYMKNLHKLGFLLGIIGYILIGRNWCK